MVRILMKAAIALSLMVALWALVRGSAVAADSGVITHVPLSIGAMPDGVLRDALVIYSPNYDSLSHGAKVTAYINIYKAVNNGALPPLTAADSRYYSASQQPVYQAAPRATQRYEPWHDPAWHPMQEVTGVLSGWHD